MNNTKKKLIRTCLKTTLQKFKHGPFIHLLDWCIQVTGPHSWKAASQWKVGNLEIAHIFVLSCTKSNEYERYPMRNKLLRSTMHWQTCLSEWRPSLVLLIFSTRLSRVNMEYKTFGKQVRLTYHMGSMLLTSSWTNVWGWVRREVHFLSWFMVSEPRILILGYPMWVLILYMFKLASVGVWEVLHCPTSLVECGIGFSI